MTKKDFYLFSIILIGLGIFGWFLSFQVFSNEPVVSVVNNLVKSKEEQIVENNIRCSDKDKINFGEVSVPEIIKLKEYQDICDSYITDTVMYFSIIPSKGTYNDIIKKDVKNFLEFKKYGIKPILILEPYTEDTIMSWFDIRNGEYDKYIEDYFFEMKKNGITESDIEMIVPLPEANVPSWGEENINPIEFGKAYVQITNVIRTQWPNISMSILFNSQSYDPSDIDWNNGEYKEYDDYISGIPNGYVQSFGIQGFPWASAANQRTIEISDPEEFLSPYLIESTLRTLKIKKVWLNTGTFYSKYNQDPERKIIINTAKRKKILSDIASISELLADKGFDVKVNIFAENKAKTAEATDWSYSTSEQKLLIRDFVRDLYTKEIDFSIADK